MTVRAAAGLAAATCLVAASGWAGPSAERGRTLWLDGAAHGTARIEGAPQLPAARFSCAPCHGRDAAGGGEGTTRAPNVGAGALAAQGYLPGDLETALAQGWAPGRRGLDRAMPRYTLEPADRDDLAAYLAEAEAERTVGVDADALRFVCVVDVADPASLAVARAYRAAWDETFAGVRAFGRLPALAFAEAEALTPALAAAAFGLLCVSEGEAAAMSEGTVPIIHPAGAASGPAIAQLTPGPDVTREERSVSELGAALTAMGRIATRERLLAALRNAARSAGTAK